MSTVDENSLNEAIQTLLASRRQANKAAITIVHISDLHFTPDMTWPKGTDSDLLEALAIDVRAQRPDIIVVTGDIADNDAKNPGQGDLETSFKNARKFLLCLCKRCELPPLASLFVIPGNHDVRILGNFVRENILKVRKSGFPRIGVKLLSWAFRKYLPPDTNKYVQDLLQAKINEGPRVRSDLDLFKEVFDPYSESRPLEPLGLFVFCLDSNTEKDTLFNFARGLVTLTQINALNQKAEQWKAKFGECYETGLKIALVHHHPMPIPEVEQGKEWEDESFVLLKNAGTTLKGLIARDMDFVLHGHQHYPGYSKVDYPVASGEAHVMSIVGAGSVRIPYSERYYYNVFSWQEGGGVKVRRRLKIKGQAAYEVRDDKVFDLITQQERHERLYKSLLKTRSLDAMISDASIDIAIDSSGHVDRDIQWKEIRPPATSPILENISFFIETESKVVYYSHTAVERYPKGKNISTDRNKLDLRFDFSPPFDRQIGQRFGFYCQWRERVSIFPRLL